MDRLCAKYSVDNPLKDPRATIAHPGDHGASQSSRCILHRIDAYGESDKLNTKDHTLEALLFLRTFMYAFLPLLYVLRYTYLCSWQYIRMILHSSDGRSVVGGSSEVMLLVSRLQLCNRNLYGFYYLSVRKTSKMIDTLALTSFRIASMLDDR